MTKERQEVQEKGVIVVLLDHLDQEGIMRKDRKAIVESLGHKEGKDREETMG